MNLAIQNSDWFQSLVDDCKATITEGVHQSRWILVEAYWLVGKRIREDENVKKHAKGNASFLNDLSKNIGVNWRTLYHAVKVYDKFPELDHIPEGKNISWNKLITKYLPDTKKDKEPKPPKVWVCGYCGEGNRKGGGKREGKI